MLNTITNLLIIFILNVLGTCLGNLKTTFLAQKAIKPVYFTTFVDAIIFIYAFKLTTNSSGYGFVLAFAAGKMFGVFLGTKIEKKLAFGLFEIDLYKHPAQGKLLADTLREQGYSVTTSMGYGIEGTERLVLNIIMPRNQFADFHKMLEQDGNVNMSVKSVTKTYGKVGGIDLISQ